MVKRHPSLFGPSDGTLKLRALRGGTIAEITSFLNDMERAYNALYWFTQDIATWSDTQISPEYRIEIHRVSIRSPGFWEFLGGMNPLLQVREYLKDRHERRKDHEYRESAEKERLKLDNMLLQQAIIEKENISLRERIAVLKDLGFDDEQISSDGMGATRPTTFAPWPVSGYRSNWRTNR